MKKIGVLFTLSFLVAIATIGNCRAGEKVVLTTLDWELKAFNEGLRQISDDGTLDAILKKHGF